MFWNLFSFNFNYNTVMYFTPSVYIIYYFYFDHFIVCFYSVTIFTTVN